VDEAASDICRALSGVGGGVVGGGGGGGGGGGSSGAQPPTTQLAGTGKAGMAPAPSGGSGSGCSPTRMPIPPHLAVG